MLNHGDKVPDTKIKRIEADGTVNDTDLQTMSRGKKLLVIAVPGAFSSTCSKAHLPGYIQQAAAIKAKGFDEILCLCVMDFFVMSAWAQDQNSGENVVMLADGNGDFTRAAGMEIDLSMVGLGTRSKRYVMTLEDGRVEQIIVEPNLTEAKATSADSLLAML